MSTASALLLFLTMTMLAAAPGAGNALVVSRSVSLGIGNGIATAAGIVTGDLVFIAIAATGISAVTEINGLARPLHLVAAGYLTTRRHFAAGLKRLSGWLLIVAALVPFWRGLA